MITQYIEGNEKFDECAVSRLSLDENMLHNEVLTSLVFVANKIDDYIDREEKERFYNPPMRSQ